jgi:FAD/FMN-containing dehydrogenase
MCSPKENTEWYRASIGGLGLTGVIVWAEIQLKPVHSQALSQETLRFGGLSEFLALSEQSDPNFEYTAGWIDCLGAGRNLGRGLFTRANHCDSEDAEQLRAPSRRYSVPLLPPFPLVSRLSVRIFNEVYYRAQGRQSKPTRRHYQGFLYPLDGIRRWNRIYGPEGFMQYQCVIPRQHMVDAMTEMLQRIATAGAGSFLSVIKMFGDKQSPAYLSFPRPGATLALDFPNRGSKTLRLLDDLDIITTEAGGAVYAAKDSRMSAECFQTCYPRWRRLLPFVDPRMSSGFWRRVTGDAR